MARWLEHGPGHEGASDKCRLTVPCARLNSPQVALPLAYSLWQIRIHSEVYQQHFGYDSRKQSDPIGQLLPRHIVYLAYQDLLSF